MTPRGRLLRFTRLLSPLFSHSRSKTDFAPCSGALHASSLDIWERRYNDSPVMKPPHKLSVTTTHAQTGLRGWGKIRIPQ